MTEFAASVVHYWDRLFHTGQRLPSTPDLTLFVNLGLDARRRAMILKTGDGTMHAAMTPAVAAAAGLTADAAAPISPTELRDALRGARIQLHAPDLVHYASAGVARPTALSSSVQVRQLGPVDAQAFQDFLRQVSEQDQEDAFVELDHWSAFGAFDGSELLSAASMYPWGGAAIADMGVLTLPHARGRGLGRALVHALAVHAMECGHQLQYRCQHDNHASIALAHSSGLARYATWEVAHEI
ncbi:MAG: GNAT family N-acetyltransferase [Xanthomonas sp.]